MGQRRHPEMGHEAVTDAGAPLLETKGLTKVYGRFAALEATDIQIHAGSIHGFLGKNGAGKSTLVKLIAGSETPTRGQILLKGEDITHLPLARRRELGVHLLDQHAQVVADLSVAENLILPEYPRKGLLFDRRAMRRQAKELLERYDLHFSVDALAGTLSAPDQRRLSIVRTLMDEGALAMLDEPTTALSQHERESLFTWIRDLNGRGQSFVFISHFNSEIQAICDNVTVLRDGKVVADGEDPRTMSSAEISELVVGDKVHEFVRSRRTSQRDRLVVRDLVSGGVGPLSFTVGEGEVLGLAGLPESGAEETARALAGLRPVQSGSISLDGHNIKPGRVRDAISSGVVYLTDDRIGEGVVGPMSIREMLRLGNWPTRGPVLDASAINETYEAYHSRLQFRVSGPTQPIEELSGGNQQKVLLGRLLALHPKVLILDEPTLGVDVATKEEVHRLVDELTSEGMSVILLAYDTDEMVRTVDRVITFQDGRFAGELTGDDITADRILARLHHKSATAPVGV
jgi:ABC-type sugar transport system ATPase subunit